MPAPIEKLETVLGHPKGVERMPVLFVGHGSPMNAIDDNEWTRGFQKLAKLLPEPKAILSISAHWYVPGTFLTGDEHPRTIHDFGGFPRELYEQQYPAPGSVELAKRASKLVGERASLRTDWGLDHGTWTVLKYLRPEADVPVVQLSIDGRLPAAGHLAIGEALAPLREEGVLILGSGNVTHNLRHAFTSWQRGEKQTPPWAAAFDSEVAKAAGQHDGLALARLAESDAGRLSHPSRDHYYPLLYVAGAADSRDTVKFPVSGFDMSSLSMRSVLYE
ncbi:MAG TPA: 4,5-DOPA dioxygenase extradiol [Myxococcales bacterium]